METDAKKFCAKCGAELEDDALFCSECGTPLPKQEETPQNETPMEGASEPPQAEVTTGRVQVQPVSPAPRASAVHSTVELPVAGVTAKSGWSIW